MRRSIALVLIAAMSACSTVETVPPVPAEVCAQPGLWAIDARSAPALAKSALPQPLPPEEAAGAGAWAGAAGSASTGAIVAGGLLADASEQSTDWVGGAGILLASVALAAGIVMAPVAAVAGAAAGVASAHSEEEIAEAQSSMITALDAARSADEVRAGVLALAEERAGRRVYDCADADNLDSCLLRSPEPVAVALSVAVSTPHFEVEGTITPDLRLLLSADAEVIQTIDGAVLYRRAWVYRGRQHGYFELAADDAALFRAEIASAEQALAAKIVDDLMIGGSEEVHASTEQPEGTVWTVLPPGLPGLRAACQ